MSQIYCLITTGDSIPEPIANLLFEEAQDMMENKQRVRRLKITEINLTGEIRTAYKLGFMGTVGGIIFNAQVDWDGGSVKTEFIVRPTKNYHNVLGRRWVRAPLFPACPSAN